MGKWAPLSHDIGVFWDTLQGKYFSLRFIDFAHCLLIIAQPHAELFKGASYVAIFRHVRWR